jgi:glycine cleavage system regulatory protein
MSKFSQAISHGFMVALHIITAAIFVAVYIVATQAPQVINQFTAFLQHYGVPIAIVNILIAFAIRYSKAELIKDNITIDSLQNDPSQIQK